MADVKIRKLDSWVLGYFRAQAQAAGRSLEEQLRHLLTDAAKRRRKSLLARIDANRARLAKKYGVMRDSTVEIRAEREERERRIAGR